MKFKSFKEMLLSNVKSHANNVALAYDEDGEIKSLTYAELYREISARREQIARLDANCVGILQAPSKKWIIDMFACVLARKQTVLLDPMSEPTVIQAQTLATDVETLLTDELTSRHASLLKTAPVGTVAPSKGRRRYSVFHVGNDKFLKSRRAYLIVFVRKRVERTSKVSLQRNGQFALHASPHPRVRLCVRNALAYVAGRKNLDHQRHCAISRKIANISNPRLYPSCLQF